MNEYSTTIKAKSKLFDLNLKEVWKYRDLIMLFVRRNFVSQYKQTILGPAWAIIQPLLTTVIFTVIFGNVAGLAADGVPSFVFYFSGTCLWTYFSTCLTSTANTFVNNRAILGKVYFPRLVMPVSSVISNLIMLAIQFVFYAVFLAYYVITKQGVQPNWYALMFPLLVIEMACLSLGVGVIISALTTKYRDLAMLISFGVQLWMYASPVAYDMYSMPVFAPGGRFYGLYMLNPVTSIINVFRYGFMGIGNVDWMYYGIGWITTLVFLAIGIVMFSKVEKTFMDTI